MPRITRLVATASLAGIVAAGMLIAGCGEAATSDQSAGSEQQTTRFGHGSVILFSSGGDIRTSPTPVRDLYAVFRHTPQERDIRVREIARADAYAGPGGSPTDTSIGEPLYSDTRLVSGTTTHGVYALPTTTESVCIGVFPDGGGGCGEPGPHGLTVDYDDASDGTPFRLHGLIGDDVRSIDAVLGGVTRHAQLGKNAYLLELPHARGKQLERLILHLRNGTTDVLELS